MTIARQLGQGPNSIRTLPAESSTGRCETLALVPGCERLDLDDFRRLELKLGGGD
jgi:hypothetical protein